MIASFGYGDSMYPDCPKRSCRLSAFVRQVPALLATDPLAGDLPGNPANVSTEVRF
jgi:hypothetical protein